MFQSANITKSVEKRNIFEDILDYFAVQSLLCSRIWQTHSDRAFKKFREFKENTPKASCASLSLNSLNSLNSLTA